MDLPVRSIYITKKYKVHVFMTEINNNNKIVNANTIYQQELRIQQ